MRRIFQLHPATHTRFVTAFAGWNARAHIARNANKLIWDVNNHHDSRISFIGRHSIADIGTIMGDNKYMKRQCEMVRMSDDENAKWTIIRELKDTFANKFEIPNFEHDELLYIFNDICIN